MPNQLPKHFEAEVRNGPETGPDVLHLVSGRTLLGVVSLPRAPPLLSGESVDAV